MASQLTEALWKEDILYFREMLVRNHANAFHTVSQDRFNREIDVLLDQLSTLTDTQIAVQLARITCLIGDGHTFLNRPDHFKTFPLDFFKFGTDFRVVSAAPAYRQVLGTRLIAIEGQSIAEVMEILAPWIQHGESSTRERTNQAWLLQQATELHGIGITKHEAEAEFTFADDDGHEFQITIASGQTDTEKVYVYGEQVPLQMQRPDDALWMASLDSDQVLYINFVRYPDWLEMLKGSYEILDRMAELKPRKLIIDLRRNGGGNFAIGEYAFVRLLRLSQNLPRNVFVLIGRITFSAAMVNAIHCREQLGALLVGEPTGAKPNQYQEIRFFSLPHSALSIGYSTCHYQFQATDTDGVLPDVHIDLNWEAFKEGRDNLIEWVLAQ